MCNICIFCVNYLCFLKKCLFILYAISYSLHTLLYMFCILCAYFLLYFKKTFSNCLSTFVYTYCTFLHTVAYFFILMHTFVIFFACFHILLYTLAYFCLIHYHSPRALLPRRTGNSKHGHAAVRHQSNGNLAAEM